jgi:two-component system response regulator
MCTGLSMKTAGIYAQNILTKDFFFLLPLFYRHLPAFLPTKGMDNREFKILLIEDDADDAELTILALRSYDRVSPILHIDDGEKALEFLYGPKQDPCLILLDLKMPRVDGIQILRKLKSDPGKQNIPVVALISSRDGKNYLESFGVKADAYIIKPVDTTQFSAVLSEIGISSAIIGTSAENGGR